jgi:hypothetical protein
MAAGDPSEELARVFQDYSVEIDAITDSFTQELIDTPVPSLIYHYTNDSGLRGILESGQLWLTDIFNLNDPSELNHGIGHALDILKRKASSGPKEAKVFSEWFDHALSGNVETSAHYFVCCFSKTDHDLGQWRAYADDGRGYAIGFDADLLEQAFLKAGAAFSILHSTFPVTYDDKRLRDIYEQYMEKFIPVISAPKGMGLDSAVVTKFLKKLSAKLANSCLFVSTYFKHEAYKNEEEYRFLQIYEAERAVPGLKIRSRPYSLVKYREFDWKGVAAESVKEVIAGPAGDQKVAFNFANDCLREYPTALGITSIKRSEIPYRSVRQ